MDPKATKPFQPAPTSSRNKTSRKTLMTMRIPGIERLQRRTSNGEESPTTAASLWEGLRLPLKRTVLAFGGLFLLILLGSWAVNIVKGMMGGSSKTATTTETPTAASSPSSSTRATGTQTGGCATVTARMGAAKVSSTQVDKVFYQKHPDRVKTPLTAAAADNDLRQEWCSIADQLIEQGKTN